MGVTHDWPSINRTIHRFAPTTAVVSGQKCNCLGGALDMIALTGTPILETERLILRAPEPGDFDVLAPFVMSDRATFVGGGADKDITHAWRVHAMLTGHWVLRGTGVFVCVPKDTGKPIGSMGPWFPEGWPEQELSWTVWDSAAEGKGYAFEAMTRIRTYAYADLGWTTAVSYIDGANARSIALAERLGCTVDRTVNGPHPDDIVYRHPAAEGLA